MGSSKKSKAPDQPTTTTNMGMFGATTTGPFGTTWTPSSFQTQFVNNAQGMMSNAQNALLNPSLSEDRIRNLNRQTNSQFQNNLLNPALSRGLLRGSTAQDIYSVGQQNYANAFQEALDREEQRNNQRLANALANYTTIYDMAKGTTGLSHSANQLASNYALNKIEAENASGGGNQGMFKLLGDTIGAAGSIGGAVIPLIAASDERLKENIKKLDEVNGYNIYEFNYVDNPKRQVGVIAQEMLDICPECVIKDDSGYYKVDYSKLPKEVFERIKKLK